MNYVTVVLIGVLLGKVLRETCNQWAAWRMMQFGTVPGDSILIPMVCFHYWYHGMVLKILGCADDAQAYFHACEDLFDCLEDDHA